MGVVDFLLNPITIFLMIFIIILAIVIVVLFYMQSKLKKQIETRGNSGEGHKNIMDEIDSIKKSNEPAEKRLDKINMVGKRFLSEKFNISKRSDYADLVTYFNKIRKPRLEHFSKQMVEALYSGESVTGKKINSIVSNLTKIIEEEQPESRVQKPGETKEFLRPQDKYNFKPNIIILTGDKKKEEEPLSITPDKKRTIQKTSPEEPEPKQPPPALVKKNKIKSEDFEKDDIIKKINSLDNEQLEEAYRILQQKFSTTYERAKKKGKKKLLEELDDFRDEISQKVVEFSKDTSKALEFAHAISKGVKIIKKSE